MILEYYMIRYGAYPVRDNPSDSGIKIHFNPEDGESITIMPGKNAVLPTGIKFGIPHGFMINIANISSLSVNRSLIVGANVVNAGYEGEVFVDLHNVGTEPQTIRPLESIAQAILVPIVHYRAHELGDDTLYDERISIKPRYSED